jgi:pimeloyl-ACP methyl ester carboxylesterase
MAAQENSDMGSLPPVTRGEARAGGIRIAYTSQGSGPALVCCHAMGWNQSLWDRHRARFARCHHLVTFDQRGCGDSDHPQQQSGSSNPYTAEGFAADLLAVLDALDIDKASLLGYSMGAIASLRTAVDWPDRVERLVLASAMASRPMVASRGLRETYRYYFSGPLFAGIDWGPELLRELDACAGKATVHGFLGCFNVVIHRTSMVDELARIRAPTLILVGANDTHYLPEAELMARHIGNARRVIISDAGHAMNVEQPGVFEDEVLGFLPCD